jgi:hypothetical protein
MDAVFACASTLVFVAIVDMVPGCDNLGVRQ